MSKIEIIKGNIFDFEFKSDTCIPHVVNNVGLAASGITIPIMNRFPQSRKDYEDWYSDYSHEIFNTEFQLGNTLFSSNSDNKHVVAHMLAQRSPGGYSVDGVYLRPIMLEALYECMLKVRQYCFRNDLCIITGKFGSLRAGGDWDKEIFPMIKDLWKNLDVTILEYNEKT